MGRQRLFTQLILHYPHGGSKAPPTLSTADGRPW